jgi:hypothetical protein
MDSSMLATYPTLRSAIQQMQGIFVEARRSRPTSEFDIYGRVGCRAFLYLDGTPASTDDVIAVPLDLIAAIEVFTSVAFAPARYQPLGDNCAVVLFWTKYGLRP